MVALSLYPSGIWVPRLALSCHNNSNGDQMWLLFFALQSGTGEGGGVDPSLMKLMLLKRIAELESEDPVQGIQVEIEAELHKAVSGLSANQPQPSQSLSLRILDRGLCCVCLYPSMGGPVQEEALPQLDEDEACHRLDEVLNDLGRPEEERLTSAKELCAAQAEAVERCASSIWRCPEGVVAGADPEDSGGL